MPEVHAIGGINGSIGIIAPATEAAGLRPAAVLQDSFTLGQVTRRVGSKASSITNSGEDTIARRGIANGRVTILAVAQGLQGKLRRSHRIDTS